jgi:nicotinamidase-related amidase
LINTILNRSMKWLASGTLKSYNVYPVAKTALVLTDVQAALLDTNGAGWQSIRTLARAQGFTSKLEALVKYCRINSIQIYFVPYNPVDSQFLSPIQEKLNALVTNCPDHFGPGLPASLSPRENDIIINDRQGISSFTSNIFKRSLLDKGIEHLLFAGPLTNISIDSSARDGVETDFHVTIVEDCCSGFSSDEYRTAIKTTLPRVTHTQSTLDELKLAIEEI